MKHNQKKYDTSQEIFYQVCYAGWKSCSLYLADFSEFKAFYTAAYIDKAIQAVNVAAKHTSSVQTQHDTKQLRANMVSAARQVQHKWQILKQYIHTAYGPGIMEINLRLAGGSVYKKASKDNWSSMRSLISFVHDFISKEFDTLTANQNMPCTFPAKFTAAADKFLQTWDEFIDAKIHKPAITSDKLKANNMAYDTLIEMMKDAQQIFRYQPEIKKQFVFSNIVSVYENKNTTRYHATASDKKTVQTAGILSEIAIVETGLTGMKNVA